MNLSRGQQLFEEMRKKWFQNKVEDMTKMEYYFKINGSCPISPTNFIFIGYIQPPISLIYLLFLIFAIYIFAKENMFGFLQVIIVFSNVLIVIPLFLVAPIIIVVFPLRRYIRTHAVPLVLYVYDAGHYSTADNSHGSTIPEDPSVNQQSL